MKKIDLLLIRSFIPPFLVAFLIALFVLVMQFLWVYIDDIIGKGASLLMLTELIFYLSVSLFPLALPIGVLMSAVMVMGNLAERYELASFKSAGISLLRVLRPIAFFAFGISIFSFICSNYLIPISNLQFKSRLHDIRKQKPTLSLEEKVFNDDFQDYTIYIGNKNANGREIEDVIIYKQDQVDGRLSQITAERGEMFMTADEQYFVMNLFNGIQNEETGKRFEKGKRNFSFVRTNFDTYRKVFDLGQFSISETDQKLFKSHQTMLSILQLQIAIDSLEEKIYSRNQKMEKHFLQYLYLEKKLDTIHYNKKPPTPSKKTNPKTKNRTTTNPKEVLSTTAKDKTNTAAPQKPKKNELKLDKTTKDSPQKQPNKKPKSRKKQKTEKKDSKKPKPKIPKQKAPKRKKTDELSVFENFRSTFLDSDQKKLFNKAKSFARSIHSHANATVKVIEKEEVFKIKHIYEMHTKISMALVCFVFLFIGGAMGAIVRKGGFGYPFLIAIIVFVLYIVMTIVFEELAETLVINAVLAAWFPIILLAPIAVFLTHKAIHDAQIVNFQRLASFFERIGRSINS